MKEEKESFEDKMAKNDTYGSEQPDGTQFSAILSKNEITRTLKQFKEELKSISFPFDYIVYRLKDIEEYIGVMNQPCIKDILKSEMDI